MIRLNLNVESPTSRENFAELETQWRKNPIISGSWLHVAKEFPDAGTFKVFHKLGFVPRDVIQTFKTGSASITYNYENFTSEYVEITVGAGGASVRFLVGKVG